jgi:hypothetical protein
MSICGRAGLQVHTFQSSLVMRLTLSARLVRERTDISIEADASLGTV